jgi:hypothetical protein
MRRVKVALVSIAIIVVGLTAWTDLEAATVEPLSMDEMAQRAEMIFVGRVIGSRADWNTQRTRIYTYVTLEVERFIKGGGGDNQITIRLWGGRVGGFTSVVPGTPQFTRGEEVLLFCAGSGARIPTVLGLSLGKFTLKSDATGDAVLKRDISGLVFANYRTDSRPVGAPTVRFRLSEVEARIRAALDN